METLPAVHLIPGDLLDMSSLMRAMTVAQPGEVYNLGAVSHVAYSWQNARLTTDVTGGGVLNMLEAIRLYQGVSGEQVRFYQASSSEMFGKAQYVPQSESTLLWPRSPYAVAKVMGHYLTINYRESLRHACELGNSLQSRVSAPRSRIRHPQGVLVRLPGSRWGWTTHVTLGESGRAAATGGSQATTSRRCT